MLVYILFTVQTDDIPTAYSCVPLKRFTTVEPERQPSSPLPTTMLAGDENGAPKRDTKNRLGEALSTPYDTTPRNKLSVRECLFPSQNPVLYGMARSNWPLPKEVLYDSLMGPISRRVIRKYWVVSLLAISTICPMHFSAANLK